MTGLVLLGVGIVALIAVSRAVVHMGIRFSDRWRWSPLMVGLLIVILGASLPELGTNVGVGLLAHLGNDGSGIAVGNVIGSCVAQVTLLLGLVSLSGDVRTPRALVGRDGAMMLAALAAMFLVCADGRAEVWEGALLVLVYVVYIGAMIGLSPSIPPAHLPLATLDEDAPEAPDPASADGFRPLPATALRQDLAWFALSLVGLAAAGLLVAQGAWLVADSTAVSQEFAGIAIGMAGGLPEMIVAMRGVRRGHGALAIGTLLGSNITDPLLSFGAGVLVHPVSIPSTVLWFDFVYWGVMSLVAMELLRQDDDLSNREALFLTVFFGIYLWLRIGLL